MWWECSCHLSSTWGSCQSSCQWYHIAVTWVPTLLWAMAQRWGENCTCLAPPLAETLRFRGSRAQDISEDSTTWSVRNGRDKQCAWYYSLLIYKIWVDWLDQLWTNQTQSWADPTQSWTDPTQSWTESNTVMDWFKANHWLIQHNHGLIQHNHRLIQTQSWTDQTQSQTDSNTIIDWSNTIMDWFKHNHKLIQTQS